MGYKLKEIFELQMGKTPSRHNSSYWNTGDYKWISIADLSNVGKYISETKETISESAVIESGIKIIPANTVVMSFKLSIGKAAITAEDMYSNEAIMAFHDKKIVELLPEYIYYLFKFKDWNVGSNKAVMGKTLNKATLAEMEIEIHTIEEQKEIIKVLDQISNIIANRKQELIQLDNLIQARFVEMFGDPITNSKLLPIEKIEERYFLKAGITTKAEDIHDYLKDKYEIPCYGGNGIRGYVENLSYEGCYPIIGRQGALCGNVQYATGKFHATEHAVLVSTLKNDNTMWVYYMLKLMDLYRYHTGAAQPGLAVKKLNTIDVIVADINLQNQFAAFVHQINKSKFEVQKSLEKTQLLYDSLMQEYFG